MRYNKIRKMDVSNGPGIRVSIFMQNSKNQRELCEFAELSSLLIVFYKINNGTSYNNSKF